MKFELKKEEFEYLKKYVSSTHKVAKNIVIVDDNVHFVIDSDYVVEFQLDINDEIVAIGMDKQEVVNDIGIKLYKIYDELLYQKKHS